MAADQDQRTSTAIRFDPGTYQRVKDAAEQLGVPINWVINRLVAEGLDAMLPPEQVRLTQRGGDRG